MSDWQIVMIIIAITFVPSFIGWVTKKIKKQNASLDDNDDEDEEYEEEYQEMNNDEEMLDKYLYLFGLTNESDIRELEKIYKKLIAIYHPDRNDTNQSNLDRTIEINNARDFLKQYWKENGSWN